MTIADKIFSYIDTKEALTTEMLNEYRNSLIFIGDERQIYNPLTGAYVGIGMSYFNQVKEEILNSTNMSRYLDQHIHENVVNKIWIEYSEEQIDSVLTNVSQEAKTIGSQSISMGEGIKLMTNQDIIVKGLHDYNRTSGKANLTDDIGWRIKDATDLTNINNTLWDHITLGTYGSSGITVNVHHTNPGVYRTGVDNYGFTYSYFEGQDYITIDDHLTWSYIASQTSYIMHFSKQMAVQQANRVYHDILGGNNPVYIEKEFNEVFTFDNYGDLTQLIKGDLGRVFIHVKDPGDSENLVGTYKQVSIYNDDTTDKYYIYAQVGGSTWYIVDTNDDNITGPIPITIDILGTPTTINLEQPTDENLKNWLFPDDGYDKLVVDEGEKDWRIAWYHLDAEATAQGQMNIRDGIQTLKEVAYILDKITDGNDNDPINLTYNIVQNHNDIERLKNWQTSLGDNVLTSVESTTNNNFIILNTYSTNKWEESPGRIVRGDAKIDIDLNLAQTYTDGINTYAAYLYGTHITANRWICKGDTTDLDYWIRPAGLSEDEKTNLINNLLEIFTANTEILTYTKGVDENNNPEFTPVNSVILQNWNAKTWSDNEYILFNYEIVPNIQNGSILDGITTVNWVTTYFRWAQEDLLNMVDSKDNDVKDWVQEYIDGMNVTYTANPGQYVSSVSQANGKISITRQRLPLDTIIHSPEIYGNDFFIEISEDQAEEIMSADGNTTLVYIYDNNYYQALSSFQSGLSPYYLRAKITSFNPINLNDLSAANGNKIITNTLLANEGNVTYFRNISIQQVDTSVGNPVDVMQLIPVDINELLTNQNNDHDYLDTEILRSLYYYNDASAVGKSNKYFDVHYRQRVDGGTEIAVSSYITYLGAASPSNTGLADAYDVRHTIESMFTWINLRTNKIIDDSHGLNMVFTEPEENP